MATACLDINANGTCDVGEPAATTDINGGFTIKSSQLQNTVNQYPVVVMAVAGTTIDQDFQGTPIASSFSMTTPPGNTSVVSPLTTLLSAKMAGGMSLSSAKASVKDDLGLASAEDVTKNYVAGEGSAPVSAHYMAVAVAEALKTVNTQDSLSARQLFIRNTVTSSIAPGVADIQAASSVADAKSIALTKISP
jgi:hypothetical protein